MRRFRRCAAVVGAALLVLLVGAGGIPTQPIQDVALDPSTGVSGASVTAIGPLAATCAGADVVTTRWDGTVIASSLSFDVPADAEPGNHLVEITCGFSGSGDSVGYDGSATFTVRPAEQPQPVPRLGLDPDGARPGAEVTATGIDFPPACTPTLAIDGATVPFSTAPDLVLAFDVPDGLKPGTHTVRLDCGNQTDDATLRVLGEQVPSTTSTPATTDTPPTASPTPTPTATATAATATAAPLLTAIALASARPDFTRNLPAPTEVSWSVDSLLRSLGLFLLLFVIVGFPAELFNKTLEENRDRLPRWWRRDPPPEPSTTAWPQVVALTLLGVVLLSLVETDAGFDAQTLVLGAALLIALPLTTLAYTGTAELYLRDDGDSPPLRMLTVGFVIAALCVAASRVADFRPGYAYGMVAFFAAGATFAARRTRRQGRAVLFGAVALLAIAMVAWFAWPPVAAAAALPGAGPAVLVADSALAATFVLALQGVVFGLVPVEYMDGKRLRDWNGRAWLAVWSVALLLFVHVLFQKYLRDFDSVIEIVAALAPFLLFGTISLGLWCHLRLTATPPAPQDDDVVADADG